jgi:hypothetical protein
MSEYMFTWYLKVCLLEASQTFACVDDSPKKLIIKDKIQPLGSQRMGLKSEQPRVTWPMYLITPFGMKKC